VAITSSTLSPHPPHTDRGPLARHQVIPLSCDATSAMTSGLDSTIMSRLCRLMPVPPLLSLYLNCARSIPSIYLSDLAHLISPSVSRCGDPVLFMSLFPLNCFGLRVVPHAATLHTNLKFFWFLGSASLSFFISFTSYYNTTTFLCGLSESALVR
jgi:hypothetical protein